MEAEEGEAEDDTVDDESEVVSRTQEMKGVRRKLNQTMYQS